VEVYNVDNQLIESAVLKNSSGVITTGGIYFFPWVAK